MDSKNKNYNNEINLENSIAYNFKNRRLLNMALTHSSYANEHKTKDNERLEFLGDAVLELVSSEFLYDKFPQVPEGKLTKMRASFVCEKALDNVARKLGLEKAIKLGKGEQATGGRERASIVSDAFEALIAAIYLDGGMEPAKEFILHNVFADLDARYFIDSKTRLQEVLQVDKDTEIEYEVVKEEGPAHERMYTIEVSVTRKGAKEVLGTGTDSSKKEAAQAAAFEALKKLGKV